jgi:hypothetical protein
MVMCGLLLLQMLAQSVGLAGQEPTATPPTEAISASVGAYLRGARVLGRSEAMVGGEASLHFSPRFSLGAAGGGLLSAAPVNESTADLGTDLRMGYGGLLLGYQLRTWRSTSLAGRVLIGAGHASVRAIPVGNELGADNFLVFEPELILTVRALGATHLGFSAGYRVVQGVQDLPTLVADDLEGLSLTLVVLLR